MFGPERTVCRPLKSEGKVSYIPLYFSGENLCIASKQQRHVGSEVLRRKILAQYKEELSQLPKNNSSKVLVTVGFQSEIKPPRTRDAAGILLPNKDSTKGLLPFLSMLRLQELVF